MSGIKKGDLVVFDDDAPINKGLSASSRNEYKGKTWRVAAISGEWVNIEDTQSMKSVSSIYASRFKLKPKDVPVDYIICLHEEGKYLPAPKPRTYSSYEQAAKVAKEMSKRHGGRFVVFKPVAAAIMPKKVEPRFEEIN